MHESAEGHALARILENNDQLAHETRHRWDHDRTMVFNFMSAPGAGKTSLLIETGRRLKEKYSLSVIEGDMVGKLDCDRLESAGIEAVQISTGKTCHLDASMVARLLSSGKVKPSEVLFIENVGNLVCPAEFPLGEHKRVVLLSVTEGDDKPIKYPVIFRNCDAVVLTKCDLLQHVDFDSENVRTALGGLNPSAEVFEVSVKTGQGMERWLEWLIETVACESAAKSDASTVS